MTPTGTEADHSDVASRADTIAAILTRAGKRQWVPLRATALQQGEGAVRTPGPLVNLIKNKDPRALELYLLAHALASEAPFDATLHSSIWARALGVAGSPASQATAISRITRRLELVKLVKRQRKKRRTMLLILDESGSGDDYQHPATEGSKERYFKLPHGYWLGGWHETLKTPAKIMLLISLSLKPKFILPISKVPDWYGLSTDTAQRGLTELEEAGLLSVRRVRKRAPLAPKGFTYDRHFTLLPPFDRSPKPTSSHDTEETSR